MYCGGAVITIFVLQLRRYLPGIRAELGGPTVSKLITGIFFILLWIAYIVIDGLQAYCKLPNF